MTFSKNNSDYSIQDIISKTKQCKSRQEVHYTLLENGFTFFDDGDDTETKEEKLAKPMNERQYRLVEYFDSNNPPLVKNLDDFISEKNSTSPNYALIRRYFKAGNLSLKKLLLLGLESDHGNVSMLSDFLFFNEFCFNLSELITVCTRGCIAIEDLNDFKLISNRFYNYAIDYGYDAYAALLENIEITVTKKKAIKALIVDQNNDGVCFSKKTFEQHTVH